MGARILATLTILIGGIGIILALFNAFGMDLSEDQQKSISAVLGLVLTIAGVWFHPDIPVGTTEEKPPE